MDRVLLRTLTEKSIMRFGQYHDLSVLELLNLRKIRYLRWVYYNCSNISFKDEILEFIGITSEFRIEKPGTNSETWELLTSIKNMKILGIDKFYMKQKTKRIFKRKRVNERNVRRIIESKKHDQLYNHGHRFK